MQMKRKRDRAITKKKTTIDVRIIEAGGGVLYQIREGVPFILLIRRNEVWDLPKGKLEADESIAECAAREVSEEVGIPVPAIERYLCETYHEYEQEGRPVGKRTFWYSMWSDQTAELTPQEEEGITELKWVRADKALNLVGYGNLVKVIEAFLAIDRGEK